MSNLQTVTQAIIFKIGVWASHLEATHSPLAKCVKPLHELLLSTPPEVFYIVLSFAGATILLGVFSAPLAGFSTYVERRVAGRMQSRIGCNRVGPEGLLQFLADGVKLLTKEDTIPKGADQVLFRMAPYFVILGAFLSFVCIPFGKHLIVADLDVGLLYLMAISSLVVVGILMAGWASNNKWSLLGAMRSAAQIVSYEIPVALALLVPILWVGSLSLQELNAAQAGGMRNWIMFKAFPAPFIAAFVYFIAALAEVNRTPFDLPEAESELVSGYSTEYSGMRWGLFFVAEYANMFLISAILVTAFLGGWQPSRSNILFGSGALFFTILLAVKSVSYAVQVGKGLFGGRRLVDLLSSVRVARVGKFYMAGIAVCSVLGAVLMHAFMDNLVVIALLFIAKVYFFVFVIIWIRWTLPRIRIDQMMSLCWKKLVPIAFACVLWTAFLMNYGE